MQLYIIDRDTRLKSGVLKCGGCNYGSSVFYGMGESKKDAQSHFDKPGEGYGRGLCGECMCNLIQEEKMEINYK